jgi:hypothetical protein
MVLQINIVYKHDVLVCSKNIAKPFENLQYVKPPNESITNCVSRVFFFFYDGSVVNPTHLMYVVHMFIKQLNLD